MAVRNNATTLSFDQLGGITGIPPEFIAAMDLHEEVTPGVSNDAKPDQLSGTVIFSRIETNRTNEKERHTYFKKPGNITLKGSNTNDQGQPVQVVRVLHPTGVFSGLVPSATTKVSDQDLGNGWSIAETSVEGYYDANGNFVASIFVGQKYETEVPDLTPEKFRALVPTYSTDLTVVGSATPQTLAPGDLDKSAQQIDQFTSRSHVTMRAPVSLPRVLEGIETNDNKYLVFVTETLKPDDGNDAHPSATKDVSVVSLGDGRVVQTERDVTGVFPAAQYSTERPDVTPEDFRALLALTSVTLSDSGDAAPITLGPGDLQAQDQQINAFVHRKSVASRPLPNSGTQLLNQEVYEGLPVTVLRKIANGPQNIAPDYLTLDSSRMQLLGDGRSVMEKKTVAGYTARTGQTLDEQFGLPRPYIVQKVSNATATTYAGTANVAIEPLDEARSLLRDVGVTAAEETALENFKVSYPADIEQVDFPPILTAINVEWEVTVGHGDSQETGASTLNGSGTLQLELPESAQGSATVIPNVAPCIQTVYARGVLADDVIFFVRDNTSTAAVLVRAGAKPWPIFQPTLHTIICKGQKINVRANANARMAISLSANGNSSATSSGGGADQETSSVTRAVTIPACIHGKITVGVPPTSDGPPNSVSAAGYTNYPPVSPLVNRDSATALRAVVSATATANILAPEATATRTAVLTANGSISPNAFEATPGYSAIPTSGIYAYRITAEPYRPGWSMVRVRTVDFALLRAQTGGTLHITTSSGGARAVGDSGSPGDVVTVEGGVDLGLPGGADTLQTVSELPLNNTVTSTTGDDDNDDGLPPGGSSSPGAGAGSGPGGALTVADIHLPVITNNLRDSAVKLGNFFALFVQGDTNDTNTTVKWYKNGIEIPANSQATTSTGYMTNAISIAPTPSGTATCVPNGQAFTASLRLPGAFSMTDVGTYYAVVTNHAGSATSRKVAVTIYTGTGNTGTVTTGSGGSGTTTTTPPNQIPGANNGDAGGTGNSGGTSTMSPVITVQPASATVAVGASATFSVVATGDNLKFQWYLGTNPADLSSAVLLRGATGTSYIISKTVSGESGSYFATVTNDAGTVSSTVATLTTGDGSGGTTPTGDPRIVQQPQNAVYFYTPPTPGVYLTALPSATFTVVADGTQPLTYQWQIGTMHMGTIAWEYIYGATGASLTVTDNLIPGVFNLNSPPYFRVIVTNSGSSTINSNAVTLTRRVAVPKIAFLRPLGGDVFAGNPPNGKVTRIVVGLGHVYDADIVLQLTSTGQGFFATSSAGTTPQSTLTIPTGTLGGTTNQYGVVLASSALFYIADPRDFQDPSYGNITFTATTTVNDGTGPVQIRATASTTMINQNLSFY